MKTRTRRLALLGLAIGVLLALVIAPQTWWLVRLQALTSLNLYHPLPGTTPEGGYDYFTSAPGDARLQRRVAERHPDDYALQYAYAVSRSGASENSAALQETLAALRSLALRFPGEPSLYANLLRHETRGNVRLFRVEGFMGDPMPSGYKPEDPSSPAALAAFDRDAAAGEQADPDDAYFPFMRAIGLLEAHRDAEALAAVHRASLKRYWREYIPEDVHNQWRMHGEAFGDPGGLGRIALFSQTLLPHYQCLRAVARITAYKAIQDERAGHTEQGLELRRDLIRCGDLMRDQSTTYIGEMVAIVITYLAYEQPGGSNKLPGSIDPGLNPNQNRHRLDVYCAYVRRIGHSEDAQAAQADFAKSEKIRALGTDRAFEPMVRHDSVLAFWWLAGLAVLANLFWLILLGSLASALARTRWARESRESTADRAPLGRKAAFKQGTVAVGVLTAVLLLADRFLHFLGLTGWLGEIVGIGGFLLVVLLVFGLPPTVAVYVMRHGVRWPRGARPASAWRGAGRKLLAVLLVAACLFSLYALARWQAGGIQGLVSAQRQFVSESGGRDTNAGADGGGLTPDEQALLACTAVALALPLLLALVLAVAACVRHVPILVGLVRGFQSTAVPLACLLVVVYGGLTLAAVRQDNVVREEAERIVTGESQYLAEKAGQSWPVTGR